MVYGEQDPDVSKSQCEGVPWTSGQPILTISLGIRIGMCYCVLLRGAIMPSCTFLRLSDMAATGQVLVCQHGIALVYAGHWNGLEFFGQFDQ